MNKKKSKLFTVGVDLGGTKISAGVVDINGRILKQIKTPTHAEKGLNFVINQITENIKNVIKKSKLSLNDIAGVGVGSPGPLNTKKGIIHFAFNFPGWKEVPLRDILQKKVKIPVLVDKDANLAAFGEAWVGAGKGVRNFLCVTLGTGVGGGLILNGELYRGAEYAAGEVGSVIIDPDGPKCACGNNGCLEAYSSAKGIVDRFNSAVKNGQKTSLSGTITSKRIFESAIKGDRLSRRIMTEAGKYLGIGLATVINLLNLEMIVIGGNVAEAGELIFEPLRKELSRRILYSAKKVKIVPAKLGVNAGLIGAARLAQIKT